MSRRKRISLIILGVLLLPIMVFIAAYIEHLFSGTTYVETFFRWLGIHGAIRKFFLHL